MNKVSIGSLQPESYINQPVYLDEKYILLSPDVAVPADMVQRLRKWGYQNVNTDGVPFEGVPMSDNSSGETTAILETNIKDQEEKKKSQDFFNGCVNFLQEYFDNFRELNALPIVNLTDKIKEIIAELKVRKHLLLNTSLENRATEAYIVHHSVKTTFLVLAIADFLKFPAHKQIEIGIAALLHKLGMLLLPSQLYQKKTALTPKELQAIMTHPVISYKALKGADFPVAIYIAVLEHHEHLDGSGYPRKLAGNKISQYGRILAVASAFVAATTKRPFRDELDGHAGIMDLLKSKGTKYDEGVLRALVYVMSVFPVGTYVKLSNSVKAVVIKTNLATPRHPVLKLLIDESGIPYSNKPVLQTRPEDQIQITGTLNRDEILELKTKLNLQD